MASPSAASTIAEQIAEMQPVLIAHFNSSYGDALTILGRAHSGRDDVVEAELRGMTCESITLGVHTPDAVTDIIVPFDRPLADLADIQTASVAAIAAARAKLGITTLTSAEIEAASLASIPTHITSAVATEMVTPHIKQITFGGGDLVNFQPVGPDQFMYVLAAASGQAELPIDSSFTWEWYDETPADDRPVGAYYTVRRWRRETAQLDIWFVLHGEGGDHVAGPASTWAAQAMPGESVGLWGPRTAWAPPADTDWYLLVGDETGLPAIATILESLPDGTPAKVFIETTGTTDRVEFPTSASVEVEVTWIDRGAEPAGTSTLLADAVRSMPWPGGNAYAWGGGESRAMTAIRKYVRHEVGLPREAVSMTGYWRHANDTTPLSDELDS
jgi:NADPH-dependent ferric siderophore reductase